MENRSMEGMETVIETKSKNMTRSFRLSSSWCGAINCSTSKGKNPELKFHRFPVQPKRCMKWLEQVRRSDLFDKSMDYLHCNVKICSLHFEKTFYHRDSHRLRMDAVPTLFDFPKKPIPKRQSSGKPKKPNKNTKSGRRAARQMKRSDKEKQSNQKLKTDVVEETPSAPTSLPRRVRKECWYGREVPASMLAVKNEIVTTNGEKDPADGKKLSKNLDETPEHRIDAEGHPPSEACVELEPVGHGFGKLTEPLEMPLTSDTPLPSISETARLSPSETSQQSTSEAFHPSSSEVPPLKIVSTVGKYNMSAEQPKRSAGTYLTTLWRSSSPQPVTSDVTVTSTGHQQSERSSAGAFMSQEVPPPRPSGAASAPGTPGDLLNHEEGFTKVNEPSLRVDTPKGAHMISLQKYLDEMSIEKQRAEKCIDKCKLRINSLRCKVTRQNKKIARLEERAKNPQITSEHVLAYMRQNLPRTIFDFFKLQLQSASRQPSGNRYSDEELANCLALYRQSHKAYDLLRARFFLPSPRSLRKLQETQTFVDTIILPF